MKFPNNLRVYGDMSYRGPCPTEAVEQVTLFNRLRARWPDTIGKIAVHPRNEGKRHHAAVRREKAEGMTPGASDIIIPGSPAFVCELKRRDHTKSAWQPGQMEYLEAAHRAGSFTCVALGADAAAEAIADWMKIQTT